MVKKLSLFLLTAFLAYGGTEPMLIDTETHKVIAPQPAPLALADFDFTPVSVLGVGGGGGGGTPGGSNQQAQFNDAANFGGIPYLTYNGTVVTLQSGIRFNLADPSNNTKRVQVTLAAIPINTTRTLSIAPGADSTTVVSASATSKSFATNVNSLGQVVVRQPLFDDLVGTINLSQTAINTGKLIGRSTAGVGQMEELTVGDHLTLVGGVLSGEAGGGTPGGSTSELQWNDSGTFNGVSSVTADSSDNVFALATRFYVYDFTDPTKLIHFDPSSLAGGSSVSVKVSANSTTVTADPGAANNFLTGITALGAITKARPSFSNLSGTILPAQNNLPIGSTLYVDVVNGSDSTGARGRIDKPYLTPAVALAAALPGDVVYVAPGTYAQGGSTLVVPSGVNLVGAGRDVTSLTSTLNSTSHTAFEAESNSSIGDMSITASGTAPALGAMSATTVFTNVVVSGLKVTGLNYAMRLNHSGGGNDITAYDSVFISSSQGVIADTADLITLKNCDIFVSVNPTTGDAHGLSANASGAIVTMNGGTINVTDGTVTQKGASSSSSGAVTVTNVVMTRDAPGFDLVQQSSGTVAKANLVRDDGAALTTSGTIIELSRYAGIDNNLSDLVSASTARTNLGLGSASVDSESALTKTDDTNVTLTLGGTPATALLHAASLTLGWTGTLGISRGGFGKAMTDPGADNLVMWDDTDNSFQYITLGSNLTYTHSTHTLASTGGGGGSSATKQDVGDAAATITAGVTVINLTTPLTASRVITLPAASSYGPLTPLVIVDPLGVESSTFTISVRRAGSDTINGGTSNVEVLGVNEAGGAVQILSDGTSAWTTIAKGGGSRVTGFVDGTTPTSGNLLVANGTRFSSKDVSGSGATISLSSAGTITIGGILNASLSNSAISIAGISTSLGGLISRDSITGVSSNGILTRTNTNTLSNISSGTGVETALAVNVGSAGAFLVNGGVLGTPSSGTLTNATGLPIAGLTSSTSTALGVGTLELGAASDTTIARSGAGAITVEGTQVLLSGAALGTPASGTLTNATGLPISGLTASTSTALGVGSIELGHATDTTIARSGAGAITVEGTQVLLSGAALGTPSSATLTNATGLPVAGITASTSTALGVGSIELGAASDTTIARSSAGVASIEGALVSTNKPRVTTISSNATWSPSINDEIYEITAQAVAATTISNPSGGTAYNCQRLEIIVTGTAARALTWSGSEWRASSDMALPTTTTTTKTMRLGFQYTTTGPHWDLVAKMDNY